MKADFNDITTWVFDLDNTLYPPEVRLFDQIEVKMTAWVMEALNVSRAEADHLRRHYWEKFGTTLAGLMDEHNVDPAPYLHDVHQIDFTVLPRDDALIRHIRNLPGRKIVYTNGTAPYARNVLRARGLEQEMEAVYGVEHANFRPKPERIAFETVFELDGLSTTHAAMFEDEARNLEVPFDMGMTTIHVAPKPGDARYIQHHTADLTTFLGDLC